MMVVTVFAVNVLGFQSLANRAAEDAGHQAGLAGLQQRCKVSSDCPDKPSALARWEILPMAATVTAREFAVDNLVGMKLPDGSPASAASYAGFFDLSGTGYSNLTELLNNPAGTQNGDGLDVEIIIPAQDATQTSDRYLNCNPQDNSCLARSVSPPLTCDTTGQDNYPQHMGSSITHQCYTHSVIILRFRLHAIQLGISGAQIEQVVVTQAGTNG